jgi:Mor family transcriptional regulator
MLGKSEIFQEALSKIVLILAEQYGGKKFTLPTGRVVKWGQQGKNRQRLYTLTVLN